MLEILAGLSLDERDLDERFVRASGPGGQNVNKVATAVELRFDVRAASLPQSMKDRLAALAGSRMTADGVLLIDSREHRTQKANREEARDRDPPAEGRCGEAEAASSDPAEARCPRGTLEGEKAPRRGEGPAQAERRRLTTNRGRRCCPGTGVPRRA